MEPSPRVAASAKGAQAAPATTPASEPRAFPKEPATNGAQPEVRLVNRTLAPAPATVVDDERLFAPEGSAEGCASGECLPGEPTKTGSELDRWKAAVEAVRAESPRHGKSLSHGRFVSLEPGTVKLAFPADAAFHRSTVFGMSRQLIEELLSKHFGRPTKVAEDNTSVALKAAAPSIAEEEAKETAARHRDIDDRVAHHPAIKNVLRILGGSVEHVQYLEPVREAPSLVPAQPVAADDE